MKKIIILITAFWGIQNSSSLYNIAQAQINIQTNSSSIVTTPLSLNDVSYLFPLPQNLEKDHLLKLNNHVPTEVLNKFPRLLMRKNQAETFKLMQAVSIRLDPVELQVRVVWQPINLSAAGHIITEDVAIHSFYQLSENEFYQLVQKLSQWKLNITTKKSLTEISEASFFIFNLTPLTIHPLIKNAFSINLKSSQQERSALNQLFEIFSPHMSPAKAVKVTAMVLRGADDMWAFMGLEKKTHSQTQASNFEPIVVTRTAGHKAQSYINTAVPFKFFERVDISGMPVDTTDHLLPFLREAKQQPNLSEQQVLETLSSVYRLENPTIYAESQLDCVHCHVAQSAREYIYHHFPQMKSEVNNSHKYQNSKYNLTNTTEDLLNTRQIRGFGYFSNKTAISQRVVHDSAISADLINQYLNQQSY